MHTATGSGDSCAALDFVILSSYTFGMRIERGIDAFLDWRRLGRDATKRSVDSYRRILDKLAEDYPEVELGQLTTADLRAFLNRWGERSAATRSNVISVLRSFFDRALVEDLVDIDPSAKIDVPRSGGQTSTVRASTSWRGFAMVLSRMSGQRSCSWGAPAFDGPRF